MNTNIEKEYKLLVRQQQFKELLSFYPDVTFKKQINTYYDNKDHMIQHQKGAMRIREVDHCFLFTLKLLKGEDLFEYECLVEKNDVTVFEKSDIVKLLEEHHIHGPFHETTSLTTNRGIVNTGYAELCFDENFYNGCVDYEIEYEYKKDHDGLTAFNNILKQISLQYEKNCPSKIKRALDCIK